MLSGEEAGAGTGAGTAEWTGDHDLPREDAGVARDYGDRNANRGRRGERGPRGRGGRRENNK